MILPQFSGVTKDEEAAHSRTISPTYPTSWKQVLELQRQVEEARAEQNRISKRIQQAGKDKAERDALIVEGKLLAEKIKAMEPMLHELEEERYQLLLLVPNIPDPSAPIGNDESDNVPIRSTLSRMKTPFWSAPLRFRSPACTGMKFSGTKICL